MLPRVLHLVMEEFLYVEYNHVYRIVLMAIQHCIGLKAINVYNAKLDLPIVFRQKLRYYPSNDLLTDVGIG